MSHYSPADVSDLAAVLEVIAKAQPDAVAAEFETSDQAYDAGFRLIDILLPDGERLHDTNHAALEAIREDVFDLACNIRWRGVMQEDNYGSTCLSLPGGQPYTPTS